MSHAPPQLAHLGDGVYASFDGYHILLRANHHLNPVVVAIEPRVYRELQRYASACWPQPVAHNPQDPAQR